MCIRDRTIPKGYINRVKAYGLVDEVNAILSMYLPNPVLFGGNTAPGKFDTLDFGAIKDGKLKVGANVQDVVCFIFQLLTAPSPGVLNGVAGLATGTLELVLSKVGSIFTNLGCLRPSTVPRSFSDVWATYFSSGRMVDDHTVVVGFMVLWNIIQSLP